MAYPIPPRSVQVTNQARFDVAEFEPLLDSNEAAALLRIHPKNTSEICSPRRDQGKPRRQALAFSRLGSERMALASGTCLLIPSVW
jgi:hypothetical protein